MSSNFFLTEFMELGDLLTFQLVAEVCHNL